MPRLRWLVLAGPGKTHTQAHATPLFIAAALALMQSPGVSLADFRGGSLNFWVLELLAKQRC
jgi:hypothetical protein